MIVPSGYSTGSAAEQTMSCRIQMLRANEKTKSHRHTSTSIDHAFRASGTTIINGQEFKWQKGDTFIVPLWSWHEHANASSSEEAILFSMHDEPILRAFGLFREEDRIGQMKKFNGGASADLRSASGAKSAVRAG